MTDIVERLRAQSADILNEEAAEEIMWLREHIELLDKLWRDYHDSYVLQVEENERLKEALREIVKECGRARGDQGHRDASRFAFAAAYKALKEDRND